MKREEIKKLIPHGYQKVIAERADVTQHAVSNFLNGKRNSYKIETVCLQLIAELQKERKQLLKSII